MSCQPGLLKWKVRSQDSPSIANALVVERVRWVKTFAQHATLEVLELNFRKRQMKDKLMRQNIHQHPFGFIGSMRLADSRFFPLLKRASGKILRAQ